MAKKSEPNAQNSELNPKAHPSGARIENLYRNAERANRDEAGSESESDKGLFGETLRPSERENRYISPDDSPAEGSRDDYDVDAHRMDPDDRENR